MLVKPEWVLEEEVFVFELSGSGFFFEGSSVGKRKSWRKILTKHKARAAVTT